MRLETTTRSAPERRRFIGLVGGGAVLAAVPWASGCASGGADGPAEPAAEETDVRRFMLAHALLAPNPHNRQPWLADLRRDGEIVLECDAGRLLPETDPFGRQIVVGCGAFVELAVIAAAERGVRVAVQVFPNGEPAASELPGGRVVARMVLSRDPSVARDPLFAQIQRRHTNKGAYDTGRDVPAAQWQRYASGAQALGLMSGSVTDAARMASVRAVTRAAYEIESVTPRTWLESARLLRIGPSEIAEHRDGIPVTSTMARLVTALGLSTATTCQYAAAATTPE